MAIIKCKMCGGDMVISDDKTYGTCEYCGSQMTLPKISDDQRAAAFNRGNHFRRIGEFDKALQVYERIVREDEKDAEAHWCCALCRFGIEYVEDPASFEYIPTCHRASFDNFLEDVDYLAAVEHSDGITRRQYQKDGAKIAEVQRGILATSQNEEPYDVFICYKETDENGDRTRDSAMAQDIYYQLTEQGRRVFFARITLEDKVGTEYEPYIFAALHSARVMVVVGTSAENLNAVWVKNEWSRFLTMMKHDRNKLLLPCYRDMDPYDLPEQLSVLQSYDMSKIGFIQDLTRGISKVLDADTKTEPMKETVVMQQSGGSNVDALLDRGYMALEDQEWDKANGFFEEVLNQDARCSRAYVGKILVDEKAKNLIELAQQRIDLVKDVEAIQLTLENADKKLNEIADKYCVPCFLEKSEIFSKLNIPLYYASKVKPWKSHQMEEKKHWSSTKNMEKAERFATEEDKKEIRAFMDTILCALDRRIESAVKEETAAKENAQEMFDLALMEKMKSVKNLYDNAVKNREQKYIQITDKIEITENETELHEFSLLLGRLGDFKESVVLSRRCMDRISEVREFHDQQKLQNKTMWQRRNMGVCIYCGGTFKGLFKKVCSKCGKPKDY